MPSSACNLRHPPSSTLLPYTTLFRSYAKFTCEPLERGFGITMGNSLRRVLLSSLQGAAITAIRIEGALHEFTSVPDVVEDVSDIILKDRKSTRLNSSHVEISYAVFCLQSSPPPELYTPSLHDALPILRQVHLRAARARLWHHDGQLAPSSAPLLASGRCDHRDSHRGRAARVHLRSRRGRGRERHHPQRSEEHTSELQSRRDLVCRLLLAIFATPRALHSFPTRRSSDLTPSSPASRSSAALASRWATRSVECSSPRFRALRSPRFASRARCTSSPPFPTWSRT